MVLTPPKMPKKDWIIAPAGSHQAVCYAIWNLGYQKTEWQGETKILPKIILAFEINETIQAEGKFKGKRYTISKEYTFNLGEKANLAKDIEGMYAISLSDEERDSFDLEKVLGENCILSIVHKESKGNVYANIKSISKLVKGMEKMTPENDGAQPDWVTKKQAAAVMPEDIAEHETTAGAKEEEEIPF